MSTEECLSGVTDSILIRKSRLRRVISGGKLHSSETAEFKDPGKDYEKKDRGGGDVSGSFCQAVSTWNLDEECLLDAFLILFEEVEQHTNKDVNAQFFISKFEPVVQKVKEMRVNMNDFKIGKLISRGAFSSVYVVKERSNGRVFAMKSISKFHPHVEKRLYLRDAELAVLSKHSSQWIVGFQYAFQDAEKIHYVLEYMSGGNYLTLLERHGGKLKEEMAKFYLGELVLAVNAVHSLGFVHRSVKPENILFDSLGHLKLSGLSSVSRISKEGKVSTPFQVDEASYEAPEILRTLGNPDFIYGVECDFWSVGVIAFETLFEKHPFKVESPLATFKNITMPKMKGEMEFPIKPKVTNNLKNFIIDLLVEKDERLDYNAILRHPFFATLIWDGIRNEIAPSIPIESAEAEVFISGDSTAQTPVGKISLKRPISNVSYIGFTVSPTENQRLGMDTSSVLDSSASMLEDYNCNFSKKDYSKLKSELEIKTESFKEKLNEIQILQMQLQTSFNIIENKDSELATLKGENKRITLDMEQIKAKMLEEEEARKQLGSKVQEIQENSNNYEINELKEEIVRLNQALCIKEAEVEEIMSEVKDLHYQVKCIDNERQNSLKREEALEETFAKSYRGSISMMEARVTHNSTTLETRIKDLELQLSQERLQKAQESEQREVEIRGLIQAKSNQIYELQGRMEEIRLAREASLEEVRLNRKKYGETIGQLQDSLERAIEDYLEMKDKFEKEHDPKLPTQIESLEKNLKKLTEDNAELKLQLNECEKNKVAEAAKAKQLDDIVNQLSQSVLSLQQQKTEIFESTKEYLRQNQNSEAMKGAQKVLEDQLTKMNETLDTTKEALYEEKQKTKELAISLQASKEEVTDCQAVIRVLTEQKEEIVNDVKNLSEKLMQAEEAVSVFELQIKDLKKSDSKLSLVIEKLESQVSDDQKDLEETQKLLSETKSEKDRIEKDKEQLTLDLEEMVQWKSRFSQLESLVKEKDFCIQEKIQDIEGCKMKMDLLQESCTVLENQLKRLESILMTKNEEVEAAQRDCSDLSNKLKAQEDLLRDAKRTASEAKSLQIVAEKHVSNLKAQKNADSESKTNMISQLHEKNEELKKKYEEKLTELNALAGTVEQLNEEKYFLNYSHESLKKKQTAQSLEISRYLNSIVNMKEEMINMKTDVHEEKQKAEFYRERAKILIEEKELVEMDKLQRETELQGQINHQIKLIHFFQSQAQQLSTKKKKFRFFGREKGTDRVLEPPFLDEASGSGTLTMSTPQTPVSTTKRPAPRPLDLKSIRKFQYDDDATDEDRGTAGNTSADTSSD